MDQNVKSDTQKLFDQIQKISEGDDVKTNIEKFLNSLCGEINLVFFFKKKNKLYYYTNCGSLFIKVENQKILILSEKNFFLKKDQSNVKQIDKIHCLRLI